MLNVLKHPEKEIAVSSPFPTYFDGGWNLKMWFLKCTNMLFSFDIPHNIYCVKIIIMALWAIICTYIQGTYTYDFFYQI